MAGEAGIHLHSHLIDFEIDRDAVDSAVSLAAYLLKKSIEADPSALVRQIGRLLGPEGPDVLEWLRRAPLHGGVAAEIVDEGGAAVSNGGDAALSGLLASTAWHAMHVLGMKG